MRLHDAAMEESKGNKYAISCHFVPYDLVIVKLRP